MSKYTNIEAVKNYVELARMNLIQLGFTELSDRLRAADDDASLLGGHGARHSLSSGSSSRVLRVHGRRGLSGLDTGEHATAGLHGGATHSSHLGNTAHL